MTGTASGLENFTGLEASGTIGLGTSEGKELDCTAQAFLFLHFRRVNTVCLTISVVPAALSADSGVARTDWGIFLSGTDIAEVGGLEGDATSKLESAGLGMLAA